MDLAKKPPTLVAVTPGKMALHFGTARYPDRMVGTATVLAEVLRVLVRKKRVVTGTVLVIAGIVYFVRQQKQVLLVWVGVHRPLTT